MRKEIADIWEKLEKAVDKAIQNNTPKEHEVVDKPQNSS